MFLDYVKMFIADGAVYRAAEKTTDHSVGSEHFKKLVFGSYASLVLLVMH